MTTGHVLLGLLSRGQQHGYDLKREHDALFPAAKELAFGQVYAALGRLRERGLVEEAGRERVDGPDRTAFRITPAGLVEWVADGEVVTPDLRVAFDAANPALAVTRVVAGERPQVVVSGDAAFATDVDWLIDNLRWEIEDDLARVVGPGVARQIAKVGGWLAGAIREGAKALRDLADGGRGAGAIPPRR